MDGDRMGTIAFFAALAVCVASLLLAALYGVMAVRQKASDWTSPAVGRFGIRSRVLLGIAAFAGVCALALYGWTY
jgi:hypothetical protein